MRGMPLAAISCAGSPFCRLKKSAFLMSVSAAKLRRGMERLWLFRCVGAPAQARPIFRRSPDACNLFRQVSDSEASARRYGIFAGTVLRVVLNASIRLTIGQWKSNCAGGGPDG